MQVVISAVKRAEVITGRVGWEPLHWAVREVFSEEVTFVLRFEGQDRALWSEGAAF